MMGNLAQNSYGQKPENLEIIQKPSVDTALGWKWSSLSSLSMNNTKLSNWAAGGEESFAINGIFSITARFRSINNSWFNSLDLGYGLIKKSNFKSFQKTDDKIDFLTKFGHKAYKGFYYTIVFNFKTQFSPGYKYPNDSVSISDFLSPAFFVNALGMDYKPNDNLSILAAPFTSKITYVRNQRLADAGAFGVKPARYDSIDGNYVKVVDGELWKKEVGGYIRLLYQKNKFEADWLKNFGISLKCDLFSNYLNTPQNIDVSMETQVMYKFNKLLSISWVTALIYDDDVRIKDASGNLAGPKIQWKSITGIGISYKF